MKDEWTSTFTHLYEIILAYFGLDMVGLLINLIIEEKTTQ